MNTYQLSTGVTVTDVELAHAADMTGYADDVPGGISGASASDLAALVKVMLEDAVTDAAARYFVRQATGLSSAEIAELAVKVCGYDPCGQCGSPIVLNSMSRWTHLNHDLDNEHVPVFRP